jgi:hypothetical protein
VGEAQSSNKPKALKKARDYDEQMLIQAADLPPQRRQAQLRQADAS